MYEGMNICCTKSSNIRRSGVSGFYCAECGAILTPVNKIDADRFNTRQLEGDVYPQAHEGPYIGRDGAEGFYYPGEGRDRCLAAERFGL